MYFRYGFANSGMAQKYVTNQIFVDDFFFTLVSSMNYKSINVFSVSILPNERFLAHFPFHCISTGNFRFACAQIHEQPYILNEKRGRFHWNLILRTPTWLEGDYKVVHLKADTLKSFKTRRRTIVTNVIWRQP